jgi:FKBP-type peptidyl-prolyl cis-trans isomerase
MKKLSVLILLLLIIGFTSCDNSDGYVAEVGTGTLYKFIEKGDGKVQGPDEVMLVQMENVIGDSVLMRTMTENGLAMTSDQGPPIITSILKMVAEGDSVHIKMSAVDYSMATRTPMVLLDDTTEMVVMKIRITKVMNQEEYLAKMETEDRMLVKNQSMADQTIIENYIAENNLDAQRTEEGLYYVIDKKGKGRKPVQGESVSVNYVVRLMDGTFIDSSDAALSKENGKFSPGRTYGPYKFALGTRAVIRGWDLGIALISKGTKAKLLVPSELGYGQAVRSGSGIPANAVLVFEVELVEIGE